MSNIQIETDLKEILTRFEQRFDKLDNKLDNLENKVDSKINSLEKKVDDKLDNIQKDVTNINLRLTKVETKLDEGVIPKLNSLNEEIKEIKSNQKTLTTDVSDLKGAKSLIIPIVVAVTTSILTLVIRTIPIN